MQRLHVLGVSEDGNALLLAVRRGARSARFSVPVDDQLIDALDELGMEIEWDPDESAPEEVESPAPESRTVSESRLSVREVQDRIRAGWSEEDVADLAGTTVEWVDRFAVPIRAEQQRVIDRARDLTFSKARSGASSRTLGESVAWNVAEKGVRLTYQEFDQSWSAYLAGDRWIIRFDYLSRGRPQVAEWELVDGELENRNRLAATLGHVEPGRKRPKEVTPPEEDEVAPKPPASTRARRRSSAQPGPTAGPDESADETSADEPAPTRAKKKRAAKRRGPKKRSATKRSAKKRPAKKAAAKKRSAKKRPAKKAAAKRRSAKKRPAKKRPAKKAPAKRRSAKKRPAKKRPAKKAPAKRRSAKKRPAKKRPAKKAPAKTRAKKRPAKKRSTKKAPAKKRSAKKRPAKKRPAKKRPAKKRSAKKAPAKKRPAKKRSAKKQPPSAAARRPSAEERRQRAAERRAQGGRRPLQADRRSAPPPSESGGSDVSRLLPSQVETQAGPRPAPDNGERSSAAARPIDAPAGGSRPVFREGLVQVARVSRDSTPGDRAKDAESQSGPDGR